MIAYSKVLENPVLSKIVKEDFLFWYSHIFLGLPLSMGSYPNPTREERINMQQWHWKWSLLPEYDNHTWDGTPDPLYEIALCIQNGKWVGVEAATSVGKTWALSILSYYFLHLKKGGSVKGIGASFPALMDTLWPELDSKFLNFRKLVPEAIIHRTGRIICSPAAENESSSLPKWGLKLQGVDIEAGAESAGGVQGRHGEYMLFILDEAAKIPPQVYTAVINTCTDPENNLILAAGNPDSSNDPLHTFITRNKGVKHIRISALDHPNIVCAEPKIGGGAVKKSSITVRLEGSTGVDDPMYLSRVRGISPGNSGNSVIKQNDFIRLVNLLPKNLQHFGESLGIDVSNSESGDPAAIAHFKGNILTHIAEFSCPNANAIAPNVIYSKQKKETYLKFTNGRLRHTQLPDYNLPEFPRLQPYEIAVDTTGVGVGTVNAFDELEWTIYRFVAGGAVMGTGYERLIPTDEQGKPILRILNIRTLAFYLMTQDISKGNIGISPTIPGETLDKLYKELSVLNYAQNVENGVRLIRKDEIRRKLGKSPNLADAFMMGNFLRYVNSDGIISGTQLGFDI